jgi:glycerophosphoryl diester phosphodiesterase
LDAADINNLWGAVGDVRTQALSQPSWDDQPAQYISGHRGCVNTIAPENTFAAFDVAAALGVSLETDVQRCADGTLVIMHDFPLDRTTGVTGSQDIRRQTYPVLKTLDASFILPGPGNIYVPQRIPTFEEYLRRYRGNLLIPEVKDEAAATGTAMAKLVRLYGMQRSTVITCFSAPGLAAARAVDPTIKLLQAGSPALSAATAAANNLWGVSAGITDLSAGYVSTMHAAGFKVFAYNLLVRVKDLDLAASYGVDGIFADDPAYFQILLNRTPTGTTVIDPPATVWQVGGWLLYGTPANTPAVVSGFLTFSGVTLLSTHFFPRPDSGSDSGCSSHPDDYDHDQGRPAIHRRHFPVDGVARRVGP